MVDLRGGAQRRDLAKEPLTLRRGNALLAGVHAAQAAVIVALSTSFALPVRGAFMRLSPAAAPSLRDGVGAPAHAREVRAAFR